ncbi:MAG: hypothetical protein U0996_07090 [Planctomycetaceae bacterium]
MFPRFSPVRCCSAHHVKALLCYAIAAMLCCGCGESVSHSPPKCELVLELPAQIKQNEIPADLRISIRNLGTSDISLVMPGDGSECAWRTPIIGWSVLPVDSPKAHPDALVMQPIVRCGNINPLTTGQIFTLKPGEQQPLGTWLSFPIDLPPGKYRVLFYYENRPALVPKGIPLGDHEQDALDAIAESDPVILQSQEVIIEVTKG